MASIDTKRSRRHASFFIPILLLFVAMTFAACVPDDPSETAPTVDTASIADKQSDEPHTNDGTRADVDAEVVEAHNRFGMLLFQRLLDANGGGDGNVFMSPTSIALALGMTYNGAEGDTAKEMAEAMRINGFSLDDVNEANSSFLGAFDGALDDLGVHLDIANSIWYRREFHFREQFIKRNERYYRASVKGLNFDDPDSANIINRWVNDATRGLIPSVVDRLDPDLVMMLINAVYFQGDWTTPFDERLTQSMPFHLASGQSVSVPMMHRAGRLDYYRGDDFQTIRLPYGDDGGPIAMYVFLPDASVPLTDFARQFTYDDVEDAARRVRPTQGRVTLPRIDIEYKATLNAALQQLGMRRAFDEGRAEFDAMHTGIGRRLYIGGVLHQSVLKVDEKGTEAAAVTSVDVRVTSVPVYEFHFKADRPFIIAIRDDRTKALLFVGAVGRPTA